MRERFPVEIASSRRIEETACWTPDERQMQLHVPRVAISYAHGFPDADVIAFSNRLRSDGVDCEIDAYDDAPMHGWGRWMIEMMTKRTVLVVASEKYYRRYRLEDDPGVGLGATFESGLLVQRALEAQGSNTNVIPVLLKSSDEQYIPEFLRDVTRYDLSKPDGYERLLRRLTDQPAHPRPPVGPVRELPPRAPPPAQSPRLALIQPRGGGSFVFLLGDVERTASLKMVFMPRDHAELARLQGLRQEHEPIAIAYASTALFGRVKEYREFMSDDGDRVEIVFEERPISDGYAVEFSFNGISSDEIAEMRARRILLDERTQRRSGRQMVEILNDSTLEAFVNASSPSSGRLVVAHSPIPALASEIGTQSEGFTAIARLACVMLLVLSGTVERIVKLDLTHIDGGVAIEFEGIRRKAYSNAPASHVLVSGACPIGQQSI
jgi:hypothetical protein